MEKNPGKRVNPYKTVPFETKNTTYNYFSYSIDTLISLLLI
jgi:hypothetical protein